MCALNSVGAAISMQIVLDEVVAKCPCCGSRKNIPFWSVAKDCTFYGVDVFYRKCVMCQAIYLTPRMSDIRTRQFYSAEYRDSYVKELKDYSDDWELARQKNRYEIMLKMLYKTKPDFGKANFYHLDIGCDMGIFLDAVQIKYAHFNPCSVGIEWNDINADVAVSKGYIRIFNDWKYVEKMNMKFDIVTISHVLEHMNNPLMELKRIYKKMNKGGVLLIEVPNAEVYPSTYAPVHPIAFTNQSLWNVVAKAGFKVTLTYTHHGLMSFPLGYYLDVIAEKE